MFKLDLFPIHYISDDFIDLKLIPKTKGTDWGIMAHCY